MRSEKIRAASGHMNSPCVVPQNFPGRVSRIPRRAGGLGS